MCYNRIIGVSLNIIKKSNIDVHCKKEVDSVNSVSTSFFYFVKNRKIG